MIDEDNDSVQDNDGDDGGNETVMQMVKIDMLMMMLTIMMVNMALILIFIETTHLRALCVYLD